MSRVIGRQVMPIFEVRPNKLTWLITRLITGRITARVKVSIFTPFLFAFLGDSPIFEPEFSVVPIFVGHPAK